MLQLIRINNYICNIIYYPMLKKLEVPYHIRLEVDLKADIEAIAFEKSMKTPDLIRRLMRSFVKQHKQKQNVNAPTTPS